MLFSETVCCVSNLEDCTSKKPHFQLESVTKELEALSVISCLIRNRGANTETS